MKKRFEAKTVEEAIVQAELDLGMHRDEFTVDVINEDTKGFLGIGAKNAVIEVDYNINVEEHCGCEDHHHDNDNDNDNCGDHIKVLKNFLNEFFRLFEVKASYKIDEADDIITVLIKGETSEDTSKLIGKKGAVLDSMNTIAQIQLNRNLDEFKRLFIDIGDYRKKRQEKVRELAIQGCERARKYGTKVSLEYMTSYDRRIVHETLAGIEGVKTFSEGNEPHRRVCIIAK